MIQTAIPDDTSALAQRGGESYARLLARLSHQSVVTHFDAYADIDWDSEEFRIDPEDPRWELAHDDELGGTEWYRAQPPETRAAIGLHRYVDCMKIGTQFENVLSRGLLEFALTLPEGSPEFRYAYHEVIEEGQHSLMFQEFVNRAGFGVVGLPPILRLASRSVVSLGRRFPELFFVFCRGGEDPMDYVQRQDLRSRPLHPLLRRIMRIHVTEEARHICFAGSYLRQHAPRLGPVRRLRMALVSPLLLGVLAKLMLRPSPRLVRTYGVPRPVLSQAYTNNPRHGARLFESLRKMYDLCREVGILTPHTAPLWKMAGICDPATAAAR